MSLAPASIVRIPHPDQLVALHHLLAHQLPLVIRTEGCNIVHRVSELVNSRSQTAQPALILKSFNVNDHPKISILNTDTAAR